MYKANVIKTMSLVDLSETSLVKQSSIQPVWIPGVKTVCYVLLFIHFHLCFHTSFCFPSLLFTLRKKIPAAQGQTSHTELLMVLTPLLKIY